MRKIVGLMKEEEERISGKKMINQIRSDSKETNKRTNAFFLTLMSYEYIHIAENFPTIHKSDEDFLAR